MVTGAALATINRLPVLLLPGDMFATRAPHPVLQQLEAPHDATVSVNDCFRPVSRYFDRIARPEQLVTAALEAMRVLTDPAETGAVTLALPEDVQAEAFECPDGVPRASACGRVYRRPPAPEALARAAELIRGARAAADRRRRRRHLHRGDRRAARARRRDRHPGRRDAGRQGRAALGPSVGAGRDRRDRHARRPTGCAREADLVIGVGTRWSDFTTASKSAFQDPGVRFVNINVAGVRRRQARAACAVEADARLALEELQRRARRPPRGRGVGARARPRRPRRGTTEVRAPGDGAGHEPLPSQAEVIGAVNDAAGETGVVVCAAGSMPGDLHKLWRARDPKGYHVEYGYSCMGYEIAGGLGVKLAAPEREVFVMVGDGSYLMLPGELPTAVAEGDQARDRAGAEPRLHVDRRAVALGRLAPASARSTTRARTARCRPTTGPPEPLPIDLAANAESLGARVIRARTIDDVRAGLARPRREADGRSSCTSRSTATRACRATRAGGTCRWPRSRPTSRCARRARSTSARGRRSASTWRLP